MLMKGAWHLILACMWLVLSAAILWTDPPNLRMTRVGLNISVGWFTLLLAGWSGVRWWSMRSAYQRRRMAEEMERQREARRPPRPEQERNPDFIFDENPPASGGRQPPDDVSGG